MKVVDTRNKDCLFVDIFPYDSYYKNLSGEESLKLTKILKSLHQYSCRKYIKDFSNISELHEYYKNMLMKKHDFSQYEKDTSSKPFLHWGCEYYHYRWKNAFCAWDDIFPLQEIEFRGEKYLCPNNSNKILHRVYGDYMAFPDKIRAHYELLKLSSQQIMELGNIQNEK